MKIVRGKKEFSFTLPTLWVKRDQATPTKKKRKSRKKRFSWNKQTKRFTINLS